MTIVAQFYHYITFGSKQVIHLVLHGNVRRHEQTSTYLTAQCTPCFERLHSDVTRLCLAIVGYLLPIYCGWEVTNDLFYAFIRYFWAGVLQFLQLLRRPEEVVKWALNALPELRIQESQVMTWSLNPYEFLVFKVWSLSPELKYSAAVPQLDTFSFGAAMRKCAKSSKAHRYCVKGFPRD